MGLREAIGNSGCKCQWAQMELSTAAAAYANGPMRDHQQQQLHMPISLSKAIGNSRCVCQWAYTKLSATAVAYANGPKRSYLLERQNLRIDTMVIAPNGHGQRNTSLPLVLVYGHPNRC